MDMPPTLREQFEDFESSLLTARSKVSMVNAFRRLFEQTEGAFSVIGVELHPMPGQADFLAVDDTTRWP